MTSTRKGLPAIFAACLVAILAVALLPADAAGAKTIDGIEVEPIPTEIQEAVERTAEEYEAAKEEVAAAKKALEDNRAKIDALEKAIPEQQARSDKAARDLYKMEQQGSGIVEMLLDSEDISEFVNSLDYAARVSEANVDEIKRLGKMKDELEETRKQLKQNKIDADEKAEQAEAALEAAKEARKEAQRKAEEEARRKAEEARKKAEAARQAKEAREAALAVQESLTDEGLDPEMFESLVGDGADWAEDQDLFVDEWAERIDSYLSGSPLAGKGRIFAEAAWKYGVDPRWSPAISCTESSKGEHCFASHNAWGWGDSSWDSWEEAINAHVRGLARGYGYTITVEAAKKYCPPNWKFWCKTTADEMSAI
jgi:hypothetical protein